MLCAEKMSFQEFKLCISNKSTVTPRLRTAADVRNPIYTLQPVLPENARILRSRGKVNGFAQRYDVWYEFRKACLKRLVGEKTNVFHCEELVTPTVITPGVTNRHIYFQMACGW